MNIFTEEFWYAAPFLAALTISGTNLINSKFNQIKGVWKQVASWGVAVAVTGLSALTGAIELADPAWLSTISLGIVVGLSSNGIYDIPTIRTFVNQWFSLGKSNKMICD